MTPKRMRFVSPLSPFTGDFSSQKQQEVRFFLEFDFFQDLCRSQINNIHLQPSKKSELILSQNVLFKSLLHRWNNLF